MTEKNLSLGEAVDGRHAELLARLDRLQTRVDTYVSAYREMYGEGDSQNPYDKHLKKLFDLLDEAVKESEVKK